MAILTSLRALAHQHFHSLICGVWHNGKANEIAFYKIKDDWYCDAKDKNGKECKEIISDNYSIKMLNELERRSSGKTTININKALSVRKGEIHPN